MRTKQLDLFSSGFGVQGCVRTKQLDLFSCLIVLGKYGLGIVPDRARANLKMSMTLIPLSLTLHSRRLGAVHADEFGERLHVC